MIANRLLQTGAANMFYAASIAQKGNSILAYVLCPMQSEVCPGPRWYLFKMSPQKPGVSQCFFLASGDPYLVVCVFLPKKTCFPDFLSFRRVHHVSHLLPSHGTWFGYLPGRDRRPIRFPGDRQSHGKKYNILNFL